VEEFNKLAQDKVWISMWKDLNVERFEELKPLINASSLRESFYISNFISGLKDDIISMLKIFKPTIFKPRILLQVFEQFK